MDAIIRSAPVSPFVRRVGRPSAAPVPPTPAVAAPVVALAPVAPAAPVASVDIMPEPLVPPASAPPVAPAAAAVPQRDFAAELARAEREQQAALARRDAEIDALREAARKAAIDLTDAYAEAEERGYAAGREKGLREAAESLQEQIERVKSLAGHISQSRSALTENAEDALVGIVFEAICRILGEQGARRETIQNAVRSALAATREREQLVLRVHPDDAALLKENAGDSAMRVSADPSVELGGCIIDSPGGSLDARFETQLELLAAALKRARASRIGQQEAV